jgi:hypothetical protein
MTEPVAPPVVTAEAPPAGLYRIGRWPEPLAWPPWSQVRSLHRFDDPERRFRVLYTAEQRLTCYLETLAALRPSGEVLAVLANLPPGDRGDDLPLTSAITADWRAARCIGHLLLDAGQRWLDLRSRLTRERVRWALATTLVTLSYGDFDAGIAMTQDRQLTQALARWAHEQGYQGSPTRLASTHP